MNNEQGINLNQTKELICKTEECESNTFIKVLRVRKIPRLLSNTGKDEMLYLETLKCADCNISVTQKQLDEL